MCVGVQGDGLLGYVISCDNLYDGFSFLIKKNKNKILCLFIISLKCF